MNPFPEPLRQNIVICILAASTIIPIEGHGALDDTVFVWGESTNKSPIFSYHTTDLSVGRTKQQVCRNTLTLLKKNAPMVRKFEDATRKANGKSSTMKEPFLKLMHCAGDDPVTDSDIWIIYTSCAMIMGNGIQWMRWTVPPYAKTPEMIVMDLAENNGIRVQLKPALKSVPATLTQHKFSGPSGHKRITVNTPEPREFDSRKYEFSYEGDVGQFMSPAGTALARPGTINSSGYAWVASDVPGRDVIKAFYRNFREHVEPPTGMASMMAEAVRQMAELADKGIPLEVHQTTRMSNSLVAGFGGLFSSEKKEMKESQDSETTIRSIRVVPGSASGSCGPTVVPEGIAVVGLDEMMRGNADGGNAGSSPDKHSNPFSDAMSSFSRAMKQMKQQMMESETSQQTPSKDSAGTPPDEDSDTLSGAMSGFSTFMKQMKQQLMKQGDSDTSAADNGATNSE